jgi:hypothetical protein
MIEVQNLQAANWQLQEANKELQKQVDRIATLHVKNRFGYDPFDNGRPLV